jgi:hypothetical protein
MNYIHNLDNKNEKTVKNLYMMYIQKSISVIL